MAESSSSFSPQLNGSILTVSFVRRRNALLVRGDLGTLFVDFMLHVADNGLNYGEQEGNMLKEGLAAFVLHCASRPQGEHIAWTLNFQHPRLNMFLTGDNEDCTLAGRLFTENVREAEKNIFYSDIVPRRGLEPRRSIVHFDGADLFAAAEAYYAGSEQRTARYFELDGDECALLLSHPDCDTAWLRSVDVTGVKNLAETETLALIERRLYRWNCGCSQEKIMKVIAHAYQGDLNGIFEGEETVRVQCPRCAAKHTITREAMEAFLSQQSKPGA